VPAEQADQAGAAGNVSGLSLHTGVAARANQRNKRERLCRQINRPAFSEQRLSLTTGGSVHYKVNTPYDKGTTPVVFEPLNSLARLAVMVPRPRVNLTRYQVEVQRHPPSNTQWRPSKLRDRTMTHDTAISIQTSAKAVTRFKPFSSTADNTTAMNR
jgi:hypothetical protein